MPRKARPLDRDGGVMRDASLIIIASEDRYAVHQYFARFKTRRVQIRVLPTEDCRSSPRHVIERLDQFAQEHVTEAGDTFWLCIDRDRWQPAVLGPVISGCHQRGYCIAMSNPCFELWVLLHFESLSANIVSCEQICDRLRQVLGGYAKQCCRSIEITEEMVLAAMNRARALDMRAPSDPQTIMTQVYKILDLLIAKEAIQFI